MTKTPPESLDDYYAQAGSWADERNQSLYASRKTAWIVAFLAAVIAVFEAIALMFLMPLKTVVPHTILVDKQTGFVQTLDPSQPQKIAPQKALTQAFLVQYVEAREAFNIATVQEQFKKVALLTSGSAKNQYVNFMQASNPESPLASLPRTSVLDVKVRSVSQLTDNSAMVRFAKVRIDQGGIEKPTQNWVAIIRYQYSNTPMSIEDRYVNPLGFQVVDYRKDAEALEPENTAGNQTPNQPLPNAQPSASVSASPSNAQPQPSQAYVKSSR
jgi:type IV secretion system protein VirB8